MTVFSEQRTIAYAKFPGLIRDATREFQQLTGFTAVTTLGSASTDPLTKKLPSPLVHPCCAEQLRKLVKKAPCEAEWRKHLRSAEEMHCCRMHICPLGLRCASLPIALGHELLGLAKFVSGQELPKERFRSLVGLLEALIARPCQKLHVLVLREEMHGLQVSVNQLREVKQPVLPTEHNIDLPATTETQTLISQVLDYLNAHYTDRDLSLDHVAGAVGKNEKYLSHLFVQQVGDRMRPYITTLRVRRACELLLQTSQTIDQIASDSGFAHTAQFRQSFRRTIGVTASEYRQVFAAGA
jgi:AraC-like DNA-binding protein